MKVPFTVGDVGHFGLAVRSPKRSAKWFERALGLKKQFEFDGGIADWKQKRNHRLAQGKALAGHARSHVVSFAEHGRRCERRSRTFGKRKSISKILAMKSVPRRPAPPIAASGSATRTVIAGN